MKKFKKVLKLKTKTKRAQIIARNFLYKKTKQEQMSIDQLEVQNSVQAEVIDQDTQELEIDVQAKEKEQIEYAEQSVTNQKSKKTKYWNLIFFIINIIVVAAILTYQLTQETITPISDIKNVKWYLLPIAILMFVVVMMLDSYRTNLFLKRSGNRSRPFLCYKMCATGKYYDHITPMSAGGEPAQIFYMSHRGLSASSAISVPMARYVVSQISWMIMGLFAVIMISLNGIMDVSVVLVIGLVGFALNFFVTSLCLLLSLSKKLGNILVVKVLKFLKKIRLIKHYDKIYDKVNNVVENYQGTMQTYAKNKWFFLYTILISLMIFILNYSLPFIIYLMFGGSDYSLWFNMMIISVIIELATSVVPLPGGTGMSEISFTVVFGSLFPEGTVFWGLLIWRFLTYYAYLVQGIGVITYDYFVGNRKFKWLQRKWELEAESVLFKEEQIKNYKKAKKNTQKTKKNK